MVVVMMLILTSTAMAAVQMRHLNSALRIEQARQKSEALARGPKLVLAIACARLESGNPPGTTVAYQYHHNDGAQSQLYRVEYAENPTNRWAVSVEPDASATALPTLPDSFN